MPKLPYHETWGEEHMVEQSQRKLYKDAEVIKRFAALLAYDRDGTYALVMRVIYGWSLSRIGKAMNGISKQAVEQRLEILAKRFPELAGVMLDLTRRADFKEDGQVE